MSRNPRPRSFEATRLDVRAFAEAGAGLDGELPLAALQRLAESLLPGDGGGLVVWRARGEQRPVKAGAPEVWLHLEAQARAPLECQRCLQPVVEPLAVDRWFRFADGEDEAERLDEASDDHDVLAASRAFDLVGLLEDELILSLPLVPRHAACPQPLAPPGSGPGAAEDPGAAAPNPFAVLSALKPPPSA